MCQVTLREEQGIIIAAVEGELILSCTASLKEKVKDYAREKGNYRLLVDLTGVSFVDSSGLGVLIAWFKFINEQQGRIVYCGLNDYVRKIVGLAKLEKIFTFAADPAEAKNLLA